MNFKSLFINEDIEVKNKPIASVKTTTFKSEPKLTEVRAVSLADSSQIDPDIKEALLQSLQDNKLAGFDYLKFITALEEMKSVAPNEDSRFKMAFIAAKQLGVDKEKLIESAQHYLDVLKQDSNEFNTKLNSARSSQVDKAQDKLTEITQTIADLQKQLNDLQQDYASLTSKTLENKSKLENKKIAFENTYVSIVSEINNNINKINQYL